MPTLNLCPVSHTCILQREGIQSEGLQVLQVFDFLAPSEVADSTDLNQVLYRCYTKTDSPGEKICHHQCVVATDAD